MTSTVKVHDGLGMEGIVKISKCYRDGHREEVGEFNMFVKASRVRMLRALYSTNISPDPIVTLKVGTGGSIDPDGLYPRSPSLTQTDLVSPIISMPVVSDPDEDAMTVTYLADVDYSEGNGEQINEVGLFTQSGALSNVKNFLRIPKTADFSIHFEWILRIL